MIEFDDIASKFRIIDGEPRISHIDLARLSTESPAVIFLKPT